MKIENESHFINNEIDVEKINPLDSKWNQLITYAGNCSWVAGKHLADMLERNIFTEWESVFVALDQGQIIGFCTFIKTDYYPENRYSPWISCIFVDEKYRGHRISGQMINEVSKFAKKCGFEKVYIPSDMIGFYEQYGFVKIDSLENYGGDIDLIFMKEL